MLVFIFGLDRLPDIVHTAGLTTGGRITVRIVLTTGRLIIGLGGGSMASYATLAEGNTYFSTRLHAEAWEDATDSEKTRALAQATSIIDQLNFAGDKTDSSQENEFPRGGDTDVPTPIKNAACEIAKALLDGVDPDSEISDVGVSSQGYSSVRSTYDSGLARDHIAAGVPSASAWRWLLPYLRDGRTFKLSRVS